MKTHQTTANKYTARQHGFSLIEVLIALVVLSIGLIGMAGIQQAGVRNNHNALLHSQASMLAYEIGDMMRSNRAEVEFGRYQVEVEGNFPSESSNCATTELVPAIDCSSQEMATFHLKRWSEHLSQRLPQGSGSITCDGSSGGGLISCPIGSTILVEVSWTESDIGGAERMSFITEVQL